jgi:uracil-DNA glycosylase family 4
LGNYATKFFLSEGKVAEMKNQPGITEIHGKIREIEIDGLKMTLIPLFHPAALIYNRSLLGEWEKDMEIVKKVVLDSK